MRVLRALGLSAVVFGLLLASLDLVVERWFPRFDRLSSNFSRAYLQRELGMLAKESPTVAFIGDSVFWGYRLRPDQDVVEILRRDGVRCRNLSFEGGSPANTYAMLRLLDASSVRPSLVVFNINQKEFNPLDSAYQRLHPSLAVLAAPLLSRGELALLAPGVKARSIEGRLDDAIAAHWKFYALRSDLREGLFGNVDAAHALDAAVQVASGARARFEAAHRPTPDRFEGTYDLSPLDATNVSVEFLRKAVELLRAERIPAVAILTPTNHALLHEFIDVPQYRSNLAYVRSLLEDGGVRVLDFDRAFSAAEFIDNDHLTAAGNRRLAELLRPVLSAQAALAE